jgi:2-iminobutanoate/2-iminopropanoate deaminase
VTERRSIPLVEGQAAPIAGATVGAGLVFVSGLAPVDLATMVVLGDDIATQAESVLDQLTDVLTRAGSSLGAVLRLECFLADPADFGGWNEAFAARFPADPPARTTLVSAFVIPGMRIEVQAVAVERPHET